MNKITENRLIVDSIAIGILGALGANLFIFLLKLANRFLLQDIAGFKEPMLPSEGGTLAQHIGSHGLWLIPVVLAVAGLIVGLLIYKLAPDAEEGTDAGIEAFHRKGGYIRKRVPFVKLVASALTIGSGGSAGREGPTVLIGAGLGSIYAQIMNRDVSERRLLVLVGMASGLSAIFRSPIGTAFFAVEVLYSSMEFEAIALIYALIGSLVAYSLNALIVGWAPLFTISQTFDFNNLHSFGEFAVLGIACGVLAALMPTLYFEIKAFFSRLKIPKFVKPAIGGLLTGICALFLPQVLGAGYGWIQVTLNGDLTMKIMIILIFAKMISFAFTVGSGGSGGDIIPSLFIGAMIGGVIAHLFHQPATGFVVVGMTAFLGAAMRMPIAAVVLVTEMTSGYELLIPAGIAVIISYLLQEFLTRHAKHRTMYKAQVPYRSDSPAHEEEHWRLAYQMLRHKDINLPSDVGYLELLKLIQSGVPINLSDGKDFLLGEIHEDSPLRGKCLKSEAAAPLHQHAEVVALLHEGDIFVPNGDTKFHNKDQVLVLAESDRTEEIRKLMAPPSSSRQYTNNTFEPAKSGQETL